MKNKKSTEELERDIRILRSKLVYWRTRARWSQNALVIWTLVLGIFIGYLYK